MSSSPIVLRAYAQQGSSGGSGRLLFQLRTWLPVLACSMVFAIESTACFGADHTSAPLQQIAETIFGYGIGAHWESIHHLIRKTGHFTGYGIFSLVCFRAFWITSEQVAARLQRQLRAHGLAILATFLVASADEFHQSFLPNRTGQFSDVLLDTCGAAVMSLLLVLAMLAVERRRQTVAETSRRLEPVKTAA